LVDRRLEPHDSNQLELKLAYGIESAERHQRYRVETFIFVPTTLGLSAKTYPAERFYEDTTGFIRLKTPTVALASLADPCLAGDWFDPLSERLDALLGGAARPDGSTSRRLKLMGCIFRRSLRSEMLDILERFDRLAPASTSEGAAGDSELSEELLAFAEQAHLAKVRLRSLGQRCESAAMDPDVREIWRAVDEFVSIVAEDAATKLVEAVDERREAGAAGGPLDAARDQLADLAVKSYQHRRARGYPSFVREGDENEGLTHRRRVLKRTVASSLYLDIVHQTPGRFLQDIIGMVAAAAAMLFAVYVTLEAQEAWPDFGAPFIAVAVISYMIKDRIKEWAKRYLARPVRRFIPDHVMKVVDVEGNVVGQCREMFQLLETSQLDRDIITLRHIDHPGAGAEAGRPETVIRYVKEVVLSSEGLAAQLPGIDGLSDIIRFNLGRLRRRMDNPYEDYRLVHPEKLELITVPCARVYHVNLVLRITSGRGKGARIETERARVIVDQRGIKRIETVAVSGGGRPARRYDPTVDMSELD
jgi:hypothetical protein